MAILIQKAGALDTVQDAGRFGYARWGIAPGGSMDGFAAAAANFLVGNDEREALLELHFPAARLVFEKDTLAAFSGADFSPFLVDHPLPVWQPVFLPKGSEVNFKQSVWGARTYLAVRGGFDVEPWLGSCSTHLKAEAGGWYGRKLATGDRIGFKKPDMEFTEISTVKTFGWGASHRDVYSNPEEIFVTEGVDFQQFTDASKAIFEKTVFQISAASDRMGFRLEGAPLQANRSEILSAGVAFGTVQLLPNGQLIILMADHQTTGGYPRIAHVAAAHLPKLAQLPVGAKFRFKIVSLQQAEEMLFSHKKRLAQLQTVCRERLDSLC